MLFNILLILVYQVILSYPGTVYAIDARQVPDGSWISDFDLGFYPSPTRSNKERKLVDVTSIPWSLGTSSPSWDALASHSSVALDSGTIVLMGGITSSGK